MPNAGEIWETLLYGLVGTQYGEYTERRDKVLAALREVGFDVRGDAAHDDAALEALPARRLVIIASDGTDDDFTFATVPIELVDDRLGGALAACKDATIDVGTAGDDPELWRAWVELALATGARDAGWFTESGDELPIDDAAALAGRWAKHAFTPGRGGALDAARFDLPFESVTFVIERV